MNHQNSNLPATPLSAGEEFALLTHDTSSFDRTRAYVLPLVRRICERYHIPINHTQSLEHEWLARALPEAAKQYLRRYQEEGVNYKFSTYFSWYIKEAAKAQVAQTSV